MAAMADDQHLFELGADKWVDGKKVEGDMHSPVATKCWRAVYLYRKAILIDSIKRQASKTVEGRTDAEIWELGKSTLPQEFINKHFEIQDTKGNKYILTEDFFIDKKNNKQLRTDFKRMIFGTVYQMAAKKGGETLNIPKEEAQVVINTIKAEFPKVFKMVEGFIFQALRYGKVVFNKRSNNHRIFPEVKEVLSKIDTKKYSDAAIVEYVKEQLGFKVSASIAGEAANAPISGTQADMLKEALVEIYRHPDYKKYDAHLLLSVHDENAAMHKGKEFGVTMTNIMKEVANRYLSLYSDNIRMEAEAQTLLSWTK